jgi:cob(I)alamin adenosyltransferase
VKIYTRLGDNGETGLLHGVRAWKNSPRLDAIGAIDELNAALGLIRTEDLSEAIDRILERVQNELFSAGTELASTNPAKMPFTPIAAQNIQAIEASIDHYETELQPLKGFILPGGVRAAAMIHVARTICRRAERQLVALVQVEDKAVSKDMLAYINRLSDLLFVLARVINSQSGVSDTPLKKA